MPGHRYEVRLHARARRELASLPRNTQRRIGRAIDDLAADPRQRGATLLVGRPDERIWRVRVGNYRILYEIRDVALVVLVIRLGHRREAYRGR